MMRAITRLLITAVTALSIGCGGSDDSSGGMSSPTPQPTTPLPTATPTSPPSDTPTIEPTAVPTDTIAPPTNTPPPLPTNTASPVPTDTQVPPTNTVPPTPTATAAPALEWGEAKFYIELTEEDIELQTFVDGSRWRNLRLIAPDGTRIVDIDTGGPMLAQGLSEMQIDGWPSHFPVLGDPEHLEIEDIDVFLDLFAEGNYRFEADTVEGGRISGEATFTHDLPGLPEIVVPEDEDEVEVLEVDEAVIRWESVESTFDEEDDIEIVEYEVIIEQAEPFRKLSVHLPGSATALTVPPQFLNVDSFYEVEVVAIEESHNQTISCAEFRTSEAAEEPEDGPEPGEDEFKETKFFIELTEEDIEVQAFVDGNRWNQLEIESPDEEIIFTAAADAHMAQQGLSELRVDGWPSHFPILGDPEHLEVESIDVFLEQFPTGIYEFSGDTVGGGELEGEASFTHTLPALPEIIAPAEDAEVDLNNLVIRWEPVTETYSGEGAIEIIGYEVIVERDDPDRGLSIHVGPDVSSLTVPPEFLEPDTDYEIEIIAIERSNNQTISEVEFSTSSAIRRCHETTLPLSLCDPSETTFTLASTNPYYPLVPGLQVILEGEEDDELVRVERTVLDDVEVVAGVETHVLEHREYVDGEILEIARNFYVETVDGTVCYFGEDVEFFEDGELVDMDGSWRAGVDGAEPGIIMPANPAVGDAYFQENAPGIATDMGRVSATGETHTIAGETFTNTVVIQDSDPVDGCGDEEEKVYVPGIGEVIDDVLTLVEYTLP